MPDAGISTPETLQFDRAVVQSDTGTAPSMAAVCSVCQKAIETEYYQVNGQVCCGACRVKVEAAARPARGGKPFLLAALFGGVAGLAGAVIYYAVMALLELEIGIVAILIGYMVGYAVRRGATGRGGRRFQVLAVILTYAAVAFAYTPIAIKEIFKQNSAEAVTATGAPDGQADAAPVSADAAAASPAASETPAAPDSVTPDPPGSGGSLVLALGALFAFIAALPVLVVIGSFPSGLISALIIFFGLQQAWRMTGVPRLEILGPFQVGTGPASP